MTDPSIQGDEVIPQTQTHLKNDNKMFNNHKMSLHSILNNNEETFPVPQEIRKQKRQVESSTEEPNVKRRRASFDCPFLDTVEHFYGAKRDEEAITALNILCEARNKETIKPVTPPMPAAQSPTTQSAPGSPNATTTLSPSSPSTSTHAKITEFFSNQWLQRFSELKEFQKQHGHTNVTRTTETFKSLGNWVAEQRRKHRKGKMPNDQFEMLSSIGFEWDRKYYFQPGHCK